MDIDDVEATALHAAADRKLMLVRPGHFKLPGRAYVSATPKQLKANLAGIKEHRLRQMDSAIFHRAEADMAARARGAEVFEPTHKELARLLKRKDKPKVFKGSRSRSPKEIAKFVDDYEDQLWPD